MTVKDLVHYLRLNVSIQDPNITQDTVYLNMSDDDIRLYMEVALSRDFPNETLETLPNDSIYPLILLSKKEMFYALAVASAPDYNLGADNNNYLKRSERFSHYMSLVDMASKEYEQYLEDGGAGGYALTSHNVTLSERYYTKYNYEHGLAPVLSLFLKEVGTDYVEIEWKSYSSSHFKQYEVYVSDTPIVDLSNLEKHISSDALKVATIKDYHQRSCKIKGLTDIDSTQIYIAVVAEQLNLRKAYSQIVLNVSESGELND